jgi:hypothetical protein
VPLTALLHEALEEWIEIHYSLTVEAIEKKLKLPHIFGRPGASADEIHHAWDNMIANLRAIQKAKAAKKSLAARV